MACLEEALINAYRNYPVLYDLSDKNYKNDQVKSNAWLGISQELQAMGFGNSVQDLKAKMKNLRDVYVRNKKRNDAAIKSGAPATSVPSWEFWGLMTWLDDYRKRKRTTTNMPNVQDHIAETPEETQEEESQQQRDVPQLSPSSTSSSSISRPGTPVTPVTPPIPMTTLQRPCTKKRKANVEEPSPYQMQLLNCLQSVAQQPSSLDKPPMDEYDYFAKSVAEQIRNLPSSHHRAMAKKHIQDVLFGIESGQAGQVPVYFNQQPTYHNMDQ